MNRVNDFAFKIATVNGTGSASANGLIMQAIFRMGIPVTGKNFFPSNIQGLPTWYEIRVNKDGYTARTPHFDLMVALNAATYAQGRRRSAARRLPALRLVAGRSTTSSSATTSRYLGVPLGGAVQRGLQGRARAHPDEEHRLRRRAGGAARHRHRGHPRRCSTRSSRRSRRCSTRTTKAIAARLRLREGALRLPAAVPPRDDGRDQGHDPDRRQHRRRRSAACTPARRSARGIRSRRRPR